MRIATDRGGRRTGMGGLRRQTGATGGLRSRVCRLQVPQPDQVRILVKIKLSALGCFLVYCSRATKPRAGSNPCWKVRGGRAGSGRAQSPRVGGNGVAGHRLWGRCAGVGSDRAGAPDDSARPAGAGTRRPVHRASAPCGRGAPAPRARAAGPSGRPGGVGRSADPGRPHVALALDVQESREAGSGAGAAGVAGQLDDGGPAPEPAGLPSAGATEAPRRHDAPRPQRPV